MAPHGLLSACRKAHALLPPGAIVSIWKRLNMATICLSMLDFPFLGCSKAIYDILQDLERAGCPPIRPWDQLCPPLVRYGDGHSHRAHTIAEKE